MNSLTNVSNISNSIKSMPVITHNGVPVVTTETIASLYDTVVGNIKTNFSRNTKRFIEGKHYFKLTGSILKDFKNKVTKSNLVTCAKNARHLTLWTERGAARHAKMLDTDQAWDVFEALEDFYFAKKEDAQQKINFRQATAKQLTPLRQTAERLIAHGVGNIYPDIWKHIHKEFGVDHINELLPEQIPLAISYLDALEGEYIPKQEENILFEPNQNSITVTIPKEGRWLVSYKNGKQQVVSVDGHNVVSVEYIQKLQRDSNALIELLQNFRLRTQVLQGEKSGDVLNTPLIS